MATHNQLHRPQFAYIGPTYAQAKKIAWKYLKDYSNPFLLKPPLESDLIITLKNEATIMCLGADKPDSLRGMYLDGAVMDEYAFFRPSVFTEIIRPALSDRGGWGVFASTPKGRNLFFDTYRKAQRDPSSYHLTYLPADSSGIIPPSELKDLRKDMSKEEFAQEYLCSFDSALKGAIYADEVNELFFDGRAPNADFQPTLDWDGSPLLYDPNLQTHFVYDLGFTDATVRIAFQYTPDGYINVVHVEATTGKDIFYHLDSLFKFRQRTASSLGGIGDVWLPHDARAKNLQTGRSIVEQFISHEIRPRVVPNHHVRDRIAATRKCFPRVRIDLTPISPSDLDTPITGDLMEALKAYHREWDDTHQVFKEQPEHDWSSDFADAFGYMCIIAAPTVTQDSYTRSSIIPFAEDKGYTYPPLEEMFQDREARRALYPRMT
jgi:hypothetical protein